MAHVHDYLWTRDLMKNNCYIMPHSWKVSHKLFINRYTFGQMFNIPACLQVCGNRRVLYTVQDADIRMVLQCEWVVFKGLCIVYLLEYWVRCSVVCQSLVVRRVLRLCGNKRIPGSCACCISGCQGSFPVFIPSKDVKFSTEGFESGYLSLADDLCPHLYT